MLEIQRVPCGIKLQVIALAIPIALFGATRNDVGIKYAERTGCLLDVRVPIGETNFPTVVWFHGGGLTEGKRHFVPLTDDKIAQVAVEYRLLGKGAEKGVDCIEDAAEAVAWTKKHIAEYGGDNSAMERAAKAREKAGELKKLLGEIER
jgi:acetyl esterase/lipase